MITAAPSDLLAAPAFSLSRLIPKDVGGSCTTIAAFTFTSAPLTSALTFPPTTILTNAPRKRGRPLTDVDGENSLHSGKKKRRLRLFLITSRLSLPFSNPASHIVDKGSSKIAIWAKQRGTGRHVLRKAAIMNSILQYARLLQQQSPNLMSSTQLKFLRQVWRYRPSDIKNHLMADPVYNADSEMRSSKFASPSAPSPTTSWNMSLSARAKQYQYHHHHHHHQSPSSPTKLQQSVPTPNNIVPPTQSPNVAKTWPGPTPTLVGISPNAHQQHHVHATVRHDSHHSILPSPLGLSNYDALDSEDDELDNFHSDFDGDDDSDTSDSFIFDSPPPPPAPPPLLPHVCPISHYYPPRPSPTASMSTGRMKPPSPPLVYSDFNFIDPDPDNRGDILGNPILLGGSGGGGESVVGGANSMIASPNIEYVEAFTGGIVMPTVKGMVVTDERTWNASREKT